MFALYRALLKNYLSLTEEFRLFVTPIERLSAASGLCEPCAERMRVGRADSRPVTNPSGCLSSRILWILVAGWKQRRGLSATALMPGMFHPVLLMAAAQLRNRRKPPASLMSVAQTMRCFFFFVFLLVQLARTRSARVSQRRWNFYT